jgi:hypothetical protein
MKIYLHIERLVLDGVPISGAERPLFQTAMEGELEQLLLAGGLAEGLRTNAALLHLRAGSVYIGKESSPKKIGTDVANAVHQALGVRGRKGSPSGSRQFSAQNRSALQGRNSR